MTGVSASADQQRNVINAEQWKVRQFFRRLRDRPFVAVVIGPDEHPEVFMRGVSTEDLRIIQQAITDIES